MSAFRVCTVFICVSIIGARCLPDADPHHHSDKPPLPAAQSSGAVNPATSKSPDMKSLWNETSDDRLHSNLLSTYNKQRRPVAANGNQSQPLEVRLQLSVMRIELDEKRSSFVASVWLRLEWFDAMLVWHPLDYDNVSSLYLTADEIWTPDVQPPTVDGPTAPPTDAAVRVRSNGTVSWSHPLAVRSHCAAELTHWPWDRQRCAIVLRSWAFGWRDLTYRLAPVRTDDALLSRHTWTLNGVRAECRRAVLADGGDLDAFDEVLVRFAFERRTVLFGAIVYALLFGIVGLGLVAFVLPPDAGEKIAVLGAAMFFAVQFLVFFAGLYPVTGASTPLVVRFVGQSLIVSAVSLLVAVASLNAARSAANRTAGGRWSRVSQALAAHDGLKWLLFDVPARPPVGHSTPGSIAGSSFGVRLCSVDTEPLVSDGEEADDALPMQRRSLDDVRSGEVEATRRAAGARSKWSAEQYDCFVLAVLADRVWLLLVSGIYAVLLVWCLSDFD